MINEIQKLKIWAKDEEVKAGNQIFDNVCGSTKWVHYKSRFEAFTEMIQMLDLLLNTENEKDGKDCGE